MSGILIDERPIMFLPTLAKALGSCERAIVLQQIHWLSRQPKSGRLIDDVRWVYGTYEEWCRDYFTMWSPFTLAKHIRNLEKDGVLISAQLKAHEHDHTKFYRINYAHELLQSILPDVVASEVAIVPHAVASILPHAVASNLPDAVASNLPDAVVSNLPDAVASINGTETSSETSSEEETRESGAPPPPPPPPLELPSLKNKSGKLRWQSPYIDQIRFDPATGLVRFGMGVTAVEVYYERFDIRVNEQRLSRPLEDDLVRACRDFELLREVLAAYQQSAYQRQRNVKLILDWYKDPARFRNNGPPTARAQRNGGNLRGAEKSMAVMDEFEKQFGDIEIGPDMGDDIGATLRGSIEAFHK